MQRNTESLIDYSVLYFNIVIVDYSVLDYDIVIVIFLKVNSSLSKVKDNEPCDQIKLIVDK